MHLLIPNQVVVATVGDPPQSLFNRGLENSPCCSRSLSESARGSDRLYPFLDLGLPVQRDQLPYSSFKGSRVIPVLNSGILSIRNCIQLTDE